MKYKKTTNNFNVTFHNPNSFDETANYLIKIIAESISDYVLNQNTLYNDNLQTVLFAEKNPNGQALNEKTRKLTC